MEVEQFPWQSSSRPCISSLAKEMTRRFPSSSKSTTSTVINDHTVGWENLNLLSHPNAILAPQARQARASGKNLNYSLSHYIVLNPGKIIDHDCM